MTATAWRPGREVELVAGTPAGGGQDRPARALISILEAAGTPARLTNIPGRGGGNAWDYLARHPENPHLLAVSSPTLITNRLLGVADFDHAALTPLATLYTEYIAFVVRADSPIRDSADFLARAGADAGALTFALATALGNTNHIALALVTQHAGGDIRALDIRVFDSALHAVAAVIAGRADVGAITAVSAAPELAAGKLRALAVSAPARLHGLYAQVPAWTEQAVDCVIGTWRGVIGTRGLTAAQTAYWDNALAAATTSAEWKAELGRQYWADTYMNGEKTRAFLDREREVMAAVLGKLGLTPPAC